MATLGEIIDNSNYAVFFGGAGVSTASNIPDFRGKNGIYNTENEWGLPPEIIISHTFFTRRTKDFYDYYKKYMVYPSAVPNAVHIALARLEKEGKIKAVLTQNIDGLHQFMNCTGASTEIIARAAGSFMTLIISSAQRACRRASAEA